MWGLITLAYLETVRAFGASPQLAGMSLVNCILLLAISGGISVFQTPILRLVFADRFRGRGSIGLLWRSA